MKKLLFLFLLLPNICNAQSLSQYGDWGKPPEKYRSQNYSYDYEIFPFVPIVPYEILPPQPYVDPLPDPNETTPFLNIRPNYNNRPEITPAEPDVVSFPNEEDFGTILIITKERSLLYTLNKQQAYLYPIGVGREGFTWSGEEKIARIEYWPDWIPPKEMHQRRRDLPIRMKGGINNPLGAVAMYLGNSMYRIHGTNEPKSIGKAESSGCFRMMNEHALHLASIVDIGTTVKVYQ